jgi:type I restriction enzyme, S subunit
MSKSNPQTTLGQVMQFQRGYDLTHSQMRKGTVPVVGSSSVIGYHDKKKIQGPALVIGRSGSVGRPQFFESDIWPHNTTLFVKDFFGNNPKFCFYLLEAINLESYSTSTGVPTLNRNFINPLKVPYIDKILQRKIVSVLSVIDDKIELNSKINAELEQMAKILYDYWFVQFDFPDANGKPYKSSGGDMVYSHNFKKWYRIES